MAQAKTEERIFPEPREESTEPNAGPKTEGPSQTSPPKKEERTNRERNLESRLKNLKEEE